MSEYIKKKGTVLDTKKIEKKPKKDGGDWYVWGITIKYGNSPKETDSGKYFSPTAEQAFFKVGQEASYLFLENEKEPKDSRIKPFVESDSNTTKSNKTGKYEALSIEEYILRKKVDTPSFTASYVSKALEGEKPEDMIKLFPLLADVIKDWQIKAIEKIEGEL